MPKNWTLIDAEWDAESAYWKGGQEPCLLLHSGKEIAWNELNLKFTCLSPAGNVYLSLDPWYLEVDGNNGRILIGKHISGSFYEGWDFEVDAEDWLNVEVHIGAMAVTITVNGQSFVYQSAAPSHLTSAQIFFSPQTCFTYPEIHVHEIPERFAAPETLPQKSLEFTVDFYDDLHAAVFNQAMLDTMFQTMKDLGANRAYWIHHGDRKTTLWHEGNAAEKINKSFDALGDDFLPPAVRSSHTAGLPLVGIFKPFDTAIGHYTSLSKAEGPDDDALGGRIWRIFDFPAEHPQLCLQRRNPPKAHKAVREIILRSRKRLDAALAAQIEVFVSEDNVTYRLYERPRQIEAGERTIVIAGLDISATFVALTFPGDLAGQIQNVLTDMVSVTDADGSAVEFTYGLHGRIARTGTYHLDMERRNLDFRTHGIDYDCAGDAMPTGNSASRHPLLSLYSLDSSRGVLGLAMTCNAQVPGILSESENEVHAWWLSILGDMIDHGVDGVEIRMMNHANIFDWEQYGFNEPVVREYQRRWGIDIRSQKFSREKFRKLRGEFFTEFLRKASALARSRGTKFYMHVEDSRPGPASEPCPMDIEMQWRTWIEEGLCDGITLKAVNFWAHDTALGRELLALCRRHEIPLSFTPFMHIPIISAMREEMLSDCLQTGFDALNIYEFASLFRFDDDGNVHPVDESLVQWLKDYDWKGNAKLQS